MRSSSGGTQESDDADVVFLAEVLGGFGNGGGGAAGVEQGLDALEAEELLTGAGGFEDAIGDEDEAVFGLEIEAKRGEVGRLGEAEWQ